MCFGLAWSLVWSLGVSMLLDTTMGFVLCPDYLLLAVGWSLYGMDLAIHVSGKFIKELVGISTAEHIKLLLELFTMIS